MAKSINLPSLLSLVMTSVALCSCNESTITWSALGTASSTAAANLSLTKFQGDLPALWRVDGSGTLYTRSLTLSFTGQCSRGIGTIDVYVNNSVSDTHAACNNNNTFSWSASVPSDGNYVLRFSPNYANGTAIASAVISKTIEAISTPPLAPVITTTGGITTSPTVSIAGTAPSPSTVAIIQSDSSGSLSFSSLAFNVNYTMNPGQTKTYTFNAVDFAGNISAGSSVTFSYLAAAFLLATDFSGAGVSAPKMDAGGSGSYMEAVTGSSHIVSGTRRTGSDGNILTTGMIGTGN
ncbi:MAG: hypothetical protein H7222_17795 [Methylotenera sp.]|nr:hypothetical protein [Oligoflexia bacterium]